MRLVLFVLALFARRVSDALFRRVGLSGRHDVRWVGGPWARIMPGVLYEEPEEERVERVFARVDRFWPFAAVVEVEVSAAVTTAPVIRLFWWGDAVTGAPRRRMIRRVEEQQAAEGRP